MIIDDEITTFNELDPHMRSEEHMLEVGRVEHAWCEHDHCRGVASRRRRDAAECAEQGTPVMVNRTHRSVGEDIGQQARHRHTILHDIGDSARTAKVVLQHTELAIAVTHEVDTRDQTPSAERHRDTERLPGETVRGGDEPPRDDPVVDRGTLADIEIVEEAVQRRDPLFESGFDDLPFPSGDHPRQQVHGERPLDAFVLLVDREGDSLAAERCIPAPLSTGEVIGTEMTESVEESDVVLPHVSRGSEHLVEERLGVIVIEQFTGHVGKGRAKIHRNRR